MKKIMILIFCFLVSCTYKKKNKSQQGSNLNFKLDKVIVVNDGDNCLTYFKLKINNSHNNDLVFSDNSLLEYSNQKKKTIGKAFYLKNSETDSIALLGIDNYYFYELGANKSGYFFLGSINFRNYCEQKDSLTLKKVLQNYSLRYNGKDLELNKIEKSDYISKVNYDNFIKKSKYLVAYKDSLIIANDLKGIEVKYLNRMPIHKKEWEEL